MGDQPTAFLHHSTIPRVHVPAFKVFPATRVVANPEAINTANWPINSLVLPLALDEVLVLEKINSDVLDDPHSIIISDTGFTGAWISADVGLEFLERCCEWELPQKRPAFAQGAVADIPVKLWFEEDRILFLTPGPYAIALENRMK